LKEAVPLTRRMFAEMARARLSRQRHHSSSRLCARLIVVVVCTAVCPSSPPASHFLCSEYDPESNFQLDVDRGLLVVAGSRESRPKGAMSFDRHETRHDGELNTCGALEPLCYASRWQDDMLKKS
jgi:hypothetical protein